MIACKDCKHYSNDDCGNRCCHPDTAIPDVIYGTIAATCNEARHGGGLCGPEARLFQSKTIHMKRVTLSLVADILLIVVVLISLIAAIY